MQQRSVLSVTLAACPPATMFHSCQTLYTAMHQRCAGLQPPCRQPTLTSAFILHSSYVLSWIGGEAAAAAATEFSVRTGELPSQVPTGVDTVELPCLV